MCRVCWFAKAILRFFTIKVPCVAFDEGCDSKNPRTYDRAHHGQSARIAQSLQDICQID